MKDKYLRLIAGGIAAALAAAYPVVDDGITYGEICYIALMGLGGTGLVAVNPTRN